MKINLEKELIALHNNAPYMFILWTEDLKFIDCNDTLINFFNLESKKEFAKKYHFVPRINIDDELPLESIAKIFGRCIETGIYYHEFMLQKPDKSIIPIYIILQKIRIKDEPFIVSYQFELPETSRSVIQINRRNMMIDAINEITQLLITSIDTEVSNSDMSQIINKILNIVGTASKADRCCLVENYYKNESDIVIKKVINEWAYKLEPLIGTEQIENIIYEFNVYDTLSVGRPFNAITNELDDYNKSILESLGIKSILCAPIHIGSYFWGFIFIGDCHKEKLWDIFEEQFLMSIGFMLATVINKFKNKN